jgi:membrane-associated phospholipid phosphatase
MQPTADQPYKDSDVSPRPIERVREGASKTSKGHFSRRYAILIPVARKAFLFFVPTASMGVAWAVVGVSAVTDLVWFPFSSLSFAPNTAQELIKACFTLAAIALVPPFVRFRLAGDSSGIANFIRKCARGITLLTLAGLLILPLVFTGVLFEYIATSADFPLLDRSLDAIDRTMGFDWYTFLVMTNAHPAVSVILFFAYWSTGPVLLGALLILSFRGDIYRLSEFLAVLALCSLCTGVLMVLVPAAGAFTQHASVGDIFSHWPFFRTFQALRTDAIPIVDFSKSEGLVTFPSFHTVLAIITTYALRDLRILFWIIFALNSLVIVSTLPEGGHYLVDVIAGIVVAGVSIIIVASVEARSRGTPCLSNGDRSAGNEGLL